MYVQQIIIISKQFAILPLLVLNETQKKNTEKIFSVKNNRSDVREQ